MRKYILATCMLVSCLVIAEEKESSSFDVGADVRFRHEIMKNVPGLPGGGRANDKVMIDDKSHMRFRLRAWAEAATKIAESARLRFYTRFTDEFRWYIKPTTGKNTFPDEVILDNLFLEGTDFFDGLVDFTIGRQDINRLYGLDHIFVDGTPGDGSRSVYADMARVSFNIKDEAKLDFFFLYNQDDNHLRWGTERGNHRSMTGLGGGAELDMDDWGFGVIWSDRLSENIPYQLFAMQKQAASYRLKGEKHPAFHRELLGAKVVPEITENIALQLEAMGQVGRNDNGNTLTGWSTYSGVNYKGKVANFKSTASIGLHIMSGDKNAAEEDGGYHAWDPMWARGVNDSELFLNGTHYGTAWWSNMIFLKSTFAVEFARNHAVKLSAGPIFAQREDSLGGGNGNFKGLLSQIRYDVPIMKAENGDFEMFGHIVAEHFNPGDYFETERPGWFVRWQVEVKF